MKQELNLEILAAYLPWKVLVGDGRTPFALTVHNFTNVYRYLTKIYLRPLTSLDKPLKELEGKSAIQAIRDLLPKGFAFPINTQNNWTGLMVVMPYLDCPYVNIEWSIIEKVRTLLLSLHFDIFGGIELGWALNLEENESATSA